jgi:hypothetical protein
VNTDQANRLKWGLVVLGVVLAAVFGSMAVAAWGVERGTRDQKTFISGADVARDVMTRCGQGPAECDAVLREMNAELRPRGLMVMEDGSVSVLDG